MLFLSPEDRYCTFTIQRTSPAPPRVRRAPLLRTFTILRVFRLVRLAREVRLQPQSARIACHPF